MHGGGGGGGLRGILQILSCQEHVMKVATVERIQSRMLLVCCYE